MTKRLRIQCIMCVHEFFSFFYFFSLSPPCLLVHCIAFFHRDPWFFGGFFFVQPLILVSFVNIRKTALFTELIFNEQTDDFFFHKNDFLFLFSAHWTLFQCYEPSFWQTKNSKSEKLIAKNEMKRKSQIENRKCKTEKKRIPRTEVTKHERKSSNSQCK